MDVDLIVFDLVGTLLHDDDAVHRALRGALATAGVRASWDEITAVIGWPKPLAIESLVAQFRGQAAASELVVTSVYAEVRRRLQWHYETHPRVRECDGASDLLAWCQRAGIQTAIGTGLDRDILDVVLRRMGWQASGLLNATTASDEVARGRPHPDMIRRLMTVAGITDPTRVMKVGDTPSDLAQGRAAGCQYVVGITTGAHTREELLRQGPTHVVSQLAELKTLLTDAVEGAA